MDVNVEIQDALAPLGEHQAGQRHVVDIAKAAGALGVGVMVAARRIEGDLGLAREDQVCADERASDRQGAVLVKAPEDGTIVRADSHLERLGGPTSPRGGPQCVQIASGVKFLEHDSVGGHRRDFARIAAGKQSHRVDGFADAFGSYGVERMLRRVVVLLQFR